MVNWDVSITGQLHLIAANIKHEKQTCLNAVLRSFDSSISLNIPSNFVVKAAPHSENRKFNGKLVQLQ